MSNTENIYYNKSGDPQIDQAMVQALESFKYFWRELSWEYRRIIPGHDLNAIKVGFETDAGEDYPEHEFVWVNGIQFDGNEITGTLLNQPNWVSSLSAGDSVAIPLERVADWMYAIGGKVYGGYTINAMRSSMSPQERSEHDNAWGLDFGNPDTIEVCYKQPVKKGLLSIFKKKPQITDEELMKQDHPMCINMEEKIREQLTSSPDVVNQTFDESENTMLHSEALAGNTLSVKMLLEFGADKSRKNIHGQTALDLAELMKWDQIVSLLKD